MTLKEAMEAVWQRPGVMYPNHVCQFHKSKCGYEILKGELYVKAGASRGAKRPKYKGYSFLNKWYGLHWRSQESHRLLMLKCTCHQPHPRPWWWCEAHGEVIVDAD